MKKKLRRFLIVLVLTFALLQLTNPARTNPPVKNNFPIAHAPPQIAVMLRAACYDCHSSETRWPWYSRVAPMSWQIAQDVKAGREELNLSDWPDNDPKRAAKKLGDMSEQIGYGEMPLKKYTWIHAEARFTARQRQELTDWLDSEAARLKSSVTNEK